MRHAIRALFRHPALALTIVGTLTVALAFTTASFGILNGLLLHPYPYPRLQQLLLVRDSKPREGAHQGRAIAVADFLDARKSVPAFSNLTGWRPQELVITSAAAEPEKVEAAAVSANFFTTLGVRPHLGQPFEADADVAGRDGVVLLSRRLWASRFGSDPAALGREIHLNGRPATILGIIRDEDCYPSGVDAWVPLVFTPAATAERSTQTLDAIGRLADGATVSEAVGQLTSLSSTLAAQFPETNRGRGFELLPLMREQYEFTAPLFVFVLAAALLVLLIALINVTTLLVARTLDRSRELSVRAMLGGSAGQVAGSPVWEVVALTVVALACGGMAAGGVISAVRASLPEGIARWVAGWSALGLDRASAAAGLGLGLLAMSVVAGVVAVASLRSATDSTGSARATRRQSGGRRFLVAGEVSLAAALLLGASVMVTGLTRIAAAFESLAPSRLLKFTLTLPESRYPDDRQLTAFHGALLDRLRAFPEVETAALIRNEPASNVPNPLVTFQRDDEPAIAPADRPRVGVEVVSPAVFETLHLDVLDGRALLESDGIDGARVAVISRIGQRRFWPNRRATGGTIRLGEDSRPVRIVGVVSDFTLNWYDPELQPVIFLPDAQLPARTTSVIIRARTEPMSIARRVRAAVAQLDDRQPVSEVQTLSAAIDDSLSPIRVIERLAVVAAALSAALAAMGIYGVLRHWVGSRRRELGVRIAVGATNASLARLVVREACVTASAGIVIGLALSIVGVRLASRAMLGVPLVDPGAVLFVVAGVTALTLAASFGPARRAARVDVIELLRHE